MQTDYYTQVAIVGGGICGLWLLNVALKRGYSALLLEKDSLGCRQTLASQGMIHGGIKYTLGGFTTPASETIAAMPDRWNACLDGGGDLDLSDVKILSRDYFLFSDTSIGSKIAAFFGSRALRGRVEKVPRYDYPEALDDPRFNGTVYRLGDVVLDPASLIESLASKARNRIFRGDPIVNTNESGEVASLGLQGGGTLGADYYIFAAGAGNEALVQHTALEHIRMQRRPLKQVMVTTPSLPSLYAHAVSPAAGAKPRVTITTHTTSAGRQLWYLGGNLAETGVHRSDPAQVECAQHELNNLLPWIDWEAAHWSTLSIDRAEPARATHDRPDSPFRQRIGNAIVCWPTKLTLVPLLADEVMRDIGDLPPGAPESALPALDAAPIGKPVWDGVL